MGRSHVLVLSFGLAMAATAPSFAAESAPPPLTIDGARAALAPAAGTPVEMQRRGGGGGFRGGGFRGGGFHGGGARFYGGGPRFYGGGARFYGGGPRFYGGGGRVIYRGGGWAGRPIYRGGGGYYGWRRPYYGYGWGPSYGYGYPSAGYRRCFVNRWGEWVCRRPYYAAPVVNFPLPFFW